MPVLGPDANPGPAPGGRDRPANPRGPGAPELGLPPARTAAPQDDDRNPRDTATQRPPPGPTGE